MFRQGNLFEPDELPAHCVRLAKSNPTVDPRDEERLTGQRAAVLAYLREHRRCTSADLIKATSHRAAARCHELSKAGHVIKCSRLKGGLWLYEYLGHSDDPSELTEEHP